VTSPSIATRAGAAAPTPVNIAGEVRDHRGQRRDANRELFGMPPLEIGRILSVESTLKPGGVLYPTWMRFVLTALFGLAGAAAVMWFGRDLRGGDRESLVVLAGFAGCVVAAGGWYTFRHSFGHRCTYVGEEGVALFELRTSRTATPAAKVLRFADAAELRVSQTRQFIHGVYHGTDYDYRWTGADGRQLFRLHGRHQGKDKPPRPGDPFHFAAAADVAWRNHYLQRAQAQLRREGSIAFRVDSRRVVRVGPGFMEFHFGGDPVRVAKDEIAKVTLGGGHFSFVHRDAKWYSSAGKFAFDYGKMANGNVFFLVLDKMMGYRWG